MLPLVAVVVHFLANLAGLVGVFLIVARLTACGVSRTTALVVVLWHVSVICPRERI